MAKSHRSIAKLVSVALVTTFFIQELSLAAPAQSVAPLLDASRPMDIIAQDPTLFQAPSQFVTMREVHKGTNGTFIIHIQDAHTNLSGQQNMAAALDEIMSKYKVSMILSEGGANDCSLTPIKNIAPKEVWERVAKSYLIQGEISGEEYLNLVSDRPMKLMGIEDMGLYIKSVENYGKLADKRQDILEYLKIVQRALGKLKNKFYPSELLDYEKNKNSGNDPNAKSFETSFAQLMDLAKSKRVDLSPFPGLMQLASVMEKEKEIDFTAANLEQGVLIEEIAKRGGKEDLEEHLKKMGEMKDKKAALFAYFQNTLSIAKEKNIDANRYQNLMKYLDYLRAFSDIDLDQVLDQLLKAEDKVYAELLPSDDSRLIRAIDRFNGLLKIAYNIQMTTKEFDSFKVNEPDFSTMSYLAFINRKLAETGYFEDLVPYKNNLDEGKMALEAFYDSVSKRDSAFIQNAADFMKKDGQQVAILISGGYHTQNLKKLFKEKGYSYAVLTPLITSETNQKKYENRLLSPIRGKAKKIETVQGESGENKKPLSALDKDLAKPRKDASGVKVAMASLGLDIALLKGMLANPGEISGVQREDTLKLIQSKWEFIDQLIGTLEQTGEVDKAQLEKVRESLKAAANLLRQVKESKAETAQPVGSRLATVEEYKTQIRPLIAHLPKRDSDVYDALYETVFHFAKFTFLDENETQDFKKSLARVLKGGQYEQLKDYLLAQNRQDTALVRAMTELFIAEDTVPEGYLQEEAGLEKDTQYILSTFDDSMVKSQAVGIIRGYLKTVPLDPGPAKTALLELADKNKAIKFMMGEFLDHETKELPTQAKDEMQSSLTKLVAKLRSGARLATSQEHLRDFFQNNLSFDQISQIISMLQSSKSTPIQQFQSLEAELSKFASGELLLKLIKPLLEDSMRKSPPASSGVVVTVNLGFILNKYYERPRTIKITQGFINGSLLEAARQKIQPLPQTSYVLAAAIQEYTESPGPSAETKGILNAGLTEFLGQVKLAAGQARIAKFSGARLASIDSLEEDIQSLEGRIQSIGINNLPTLGFHGQANRPNNAYFYFVFKDKTETFFKGMDMNPGEFFERLQGTIISTANYSEFSWSNNVMPKIHILSETPGFNIVKANDKDPSGRLSMLDVKQRKINQYRYFFGEGTAQTGEIPLEAIHEITLSDEEFREIQETAIAVKKADPSIAISEDVVRTNLNYRILYKKALETITSLAGARLAIQQNSFPRADYTIWADKALTDQLKRSHYVAQFYNDFKRHHNGKGAVPLQGTGLLSGSAADEFVRKQLLPEMNEIADELRRRGHKVPGYAINFEGYFHSYSAGARLATATSIPAAIPGRAPFIVSRSSLRVSKQEIHDWNEVVAELRKILTNGKEAVKYSRIETAFLFNGKPEALASFNLLKQLYPDLVFRAIFESPITPAEALKQSIEKNPDLAWELQLDEKGGVIRIIGSKPGSAGARLSAENVIQGDLRRAEEIALSISETPAEVELEGTVFSIVGKLNDEFEIRVTSGGKTQQLAWIVPDDLNLRESRINRIRIYAETDGNLAWSSVDTQTSGGISGKSSIPILAPQGLGKGFVINGPRNGNEQITVFNEYVRSPFTFRGQLTALSQSAVGAYARYEHKFNEAFARGKVKVMDANDPDYQFTSPVLKLESDGKKADLPFVVLAYEAKRVMQYALVHSQKENGQWKLIERIGLSPNTDGPYRNLMVLYEFLDELPADIRAELVSKYSGARLAVAGDETIEEPLSTTYHVVPKQEVLQKGDMVSLNNSDSVFLAARAFAANPKGLSLPIPLEFKDKVAAITVSQAEDNPNEAVIDFFVFNEGGDRVPIGTIRLSKDTLDRAKEANEKARETVTRQTLATEVSPAVATTAIILRDVRLGLREVHGISGQREPAKRITLSQTRIIRKTFSEAEYAALSEGDRMLMKMAERQVKSQMGDGQVLYQYGVINANNEFAADPNFSDQIPEQILSVAKVVFQGSLPDTFLKDLGRLNQSRLEAVKYGVVLTESRAVDTNKGNVIPDIAADLASVMVGSPDFNPESVLSYIQRYTNKATESVNMTEALNAMNAVPLNATQRYYRDRGLVFQPIAALLWQQILETARMVTQAVGGAA